MNVLELRRELDLICHINGMEMGWMNFVIENIYEEGDVVTSRKPEIPT